jgi:DNA-binding MarR family transcriptional regulator
VREGFFTDEVVAIIDAMAIAARRPATDSPAALSEDLCWLLSRASQSLTNQLTAALAEAGLSPRAYCVLSTAMTSQYTQTALAHAVGLDKTTMVVTIDELEAAGLAERRPAAGDRRARVIAVTKAGAKKVGEAKRIVARTQAEVLESLPARERAALVGALARLVEPG